MFAAQTQGSRLGGVDASSASRGMCARTGGAKLAIGIGIGVLVLAMGGTAYAKDYMGNGGPNVIKGTSKADRLNGSAGNDLILGGSGRDTLIGGLGNDRIFGGAGRDRIFVADGGPDFVDCGPGRDTVKADKSDTLKNCEQIGYVVIPAAPPPVAPPPPTVPAPNPTPAPPVPVAPPAAPVGLKPPINGVLGGPGTYATTPDAYNAYVYTYQQFAVPWLDYYWGNLIGQDRYVNGLNYYQALQGVQPTTTVDCERTGPAPIVNNAMYCAPPPGQYFHNGNPRWDFIVWDDAFMFNIFNTVGDGAVVGIIAHEWGHAVQYRLQWDIYTTEHVSIELNADCLQGVFERFLLDNNLVTAEIANQVGAFLSQYNGDGGGDHGTTQQRIDAINYGFTYGADNCRNYLF